MQSSIDIQNDSKATCHNYEGICYKYEGTCYSKQLNSSVLLHLTTLLLSFQQQQLDTLSVKIQDCFKTFQQLSFDRINHQEVEQFLQDYKHLDGTQNGLRLMRMLVDKLIMAFHNNSRIGRKVKDGLTFNCLILFVKALTHKKLIQEQLRATIKAYQIGITLKHKNIQVFNLGVKASEKIQYSLFQNFSAEILAALKCQIEQSKKGIVKNVSLASTVYNKFNGKDGKQNKRCALSSIYLRNKQSIKRVNISQHKMLSSQVSNPLSRPTYNKTPTIQPHKFFSKKHSSSIYNSGQSSSNISSSNPKTNPKTKSQLLSYYLLLFEMYIICVLRYKSQIKKKYTRQCITQLRDKLVCNYPGRGIEQVLVDIQANKIKIYQQNQSYVHLNTTQTSNNRINHMHKQQITNKQQILNKQQTFNKQPISFKTAKIKLCLDKFHKTKQIQEKFTQFSERQLKKQKIFVRTSFTQKANGNTDQKKVQNIRIKSKTSHFSTNNDKDNLLLSSNFDKDEQTYKINQIKNISNKQSSQDYQMNVKRIKREITSKRLQKKQENQFITQNKPILRQQNEQNAISQKSEPQIKQSIQQSQPSIILSNQIIKSSSPTNQSPTNMNNNINDIGIILNTQQSYEIQLIQDFNILKDKEKLNEEKRFMKQMFLKRGSIQITNSSIHFNNHAILSPHIQSYSQQKFHQAINQLEEDQSYQSEGQAKQQQQISQQVKQQQQINLFKDIYQEQQIINEQTNFTKAQELTNLEKIIQKTQDRIDIEIKSIQTQPKQQNLSPVLSQLKQIKQLSKNSTNQNTVVLKKKKIKQQAILSIQRQIDNQNKEKKISPSQEIQILHIPISTGLIISNQVHFYLNQNLYQDLLIQKYSSSINKISKQVQYIQQSNLIKSIQQISQIEQNNQLILKQNQQNKVIIVVNQIESINDQDDIIQNNNKQDKINQNKLQNQLYQQKLVKSQQDIEIEQEIMYQYLKHIEDILLYQQAFYPQQVKSVQLQLKQNSNIPIQVSQFSNNLNIFLQNQINNNRNNNIFNTQQILQNNHQGLGQISQNLNFNRSLIKQNQLLKKVQNSQVEQKQVEKIVKFEYVSQKQDAQQQKQYRQINEVAKLVLDDLKSIQIKYKSHFLQISLSKQNEQKLIIKLIRRPNQITSKNTRKFTHILLLNSDAQSVHDLEWQNKIQQQINKIQDVEVFLSFNQQANVVKMFTYRNVRIQMVQHFGQVIPKLRVFGMWYRLEALLMLLRNPKTHLKIKCQFQIFQFVYQCPSNPLSPHYNLLIKNPQNEIIVLKDLYFQQRNKILESLAVVIGSSVKMQKQTKKVRFICGGQKIKSLLKLSARKKTCGCQTDQLATQSLLPSKSSV